MNEVEEFIENLAKKNKYKKLDSVQSKIVREWYLSNLPQSLLSMSKDVNLYSTSGTLIATRFERLVVGDYGAFIEIHKSNLILENIVVKQGQEYRIENPEYSENVKYFWYTTRDSSDCKIYHQQKTVDYADYKGGGDYVYISPYELMIQKK